MSTIANCEQLYYTLTCAAQDYDPNFYYFLSKTQDCDGLNNFRHFREMHCLFVSSKSEKRAICLSQKWTLPYLKSSLTFANRIRFGLRCGWNWVKNTKKY